MMDNFGGLPCEVELTDERLKGGLGSLSTGNSVCAQSISSIEKELGGVSSTCLKLFKI